MVAWHYDPELKRYFRESLTSSRIQIISAPQGYGKTLALSSYAQSLKSSGALC